MAPSPLMPRPLDMGQYNALEVVECLPTGVLLGAPGQDLFLPTHRLSGEVTVGDTIEVFIYGDHDGAPQATTLKPAAVAGEFAWLECVSVTRAGAYLAWGLPKDLYAPPAEQPTPPMVVGRRYVVAVCLDRRGERLIASCRLSSHFDNGVDSIAPEDEVDLLVYGHTDAGVQVIVERRYRGLIHDSDVYRKLSVGAQLRGFVRNVRHDHRLDIALTRCGPEGIFDATEVVLQALKDAGGWLPLHDRSPPIAIEKALGMSKKAFKRGAGVLYRAKKIIIEDEGIRLVEP